MALSEFAKATMSDVLDMPCDDQFEIATRVATNIGYRLVPGESVQEAEDRADILARLDRVEAAIQELNPGWRP